MHMCMEPQLEGVKHWLVHIGVKSTLIDQAIYDIINAIKSPDYVSDNQSEFRPGSDHNSIFGIEILW